MRVYEGSPDNVVGIVNTKDLFHLFSLRGDDIGPSEVFHSNRRVGHPGKSPFEESTEQSGRASRTEHPGPGGRLRGAR